MPASVTQPPPADPTPSRVVELSTNIDDAPGEQLGHAVRTLLAEGALDVWTTPIQMKKQRPGVLLSVLTPENDAQATALRIMQLTGSFGVRHRGWDRTVLARDMVTLTTRFGPLPIKVGRWEGRVVAAAPEFDACVAAAERHGVSPSAVVDAGRVAAADWIARSGEADA